jgi:hypothetical protein
MPQLGETVTEGTVTRWHKAVGEAVATRSFERVAVRWLEALAYRGPTSFGGAAENVRPRGKQATSGRGRLSCSSWNLVSRRGDSHPPPLSGPDVTVSYHPAPTGRPEVRTIRCQ